MLFASQSIGLYCFLLSTWGQRQRQMPPGPPFRILSSAIGFQFDSQHLTPTVRAMATTHTHLPLTMLAIMINQVIHIYQAITMSRLVSLRHTQILNMRTKLLMEAAKTPIFHLLIPLMKHCLRLQQRRMPIFTIIHIRHRTLIRLIHLILITTTTADIIVQVALLHGATGRETWH